MATELFLVGNQVVQRVVTHLADQDRGLHLFFCEAAFPPRLSVTVSRNQMVLAVHLGAAAKFARRCHVLRLMVQVDVEFRPPVTSLYAVGSPRGASCCDWAYRVPHCQGDGLQSALFFVVEPSCWKTLRIPERP